MTGKNGIQQVFGKVTIDSYYLFHQLGTQGSIMHGDHHFIISKSAKSIQTIQEDNPIYYPSMASSTTRKEFTQILKSNSIATRKLFAKKSYT